jgi:hypothetical protein
MARTKSNIYLDDILPDSFHTSKPFDDHILLQYFKPSPIYTTIASSILLLVTVQIGIHLDLLSLVPISSKCEKKKNLGLQPLQGFLGEIFEKKFQKSKVFEPDLGGQNVSRRITKMPTSPVAKSGYISCGWLQVRLQHKSKTIVIIILIF